MAMEEGTSKLMLEREKNDLSPPNFKQASPPQVRQDIVLLHPGATEKTVSKHQISPEAKHTKTAAAGGLQAANERQEAGDL